MDLICGTKVLFAPDVAQHGRSRKTTARKHGPKARPKSTAHDTAYERVSTAPSRGMRSGRDARAGPMRRRFQHFRGVAHGGQETKAGRRFVQTIAHIVEAGIAAMHAVDTAELAEPVTGLCERDPYVPGTALLGAALERRHDREGQDITGRVVERLRRQGSRLGRTERLRFGQIQSARCLDERIEAAARRPRTVVAVSGQRGVDDPRAEAGELLRAESVRGDGTGPIAPE